MEEKRNIKSHSIFWKDREQGNITGVRDVISFEEDCVQLNTEQGKMTIKGKELHISRLTLEQGELDITGKVESITYTGNAPGYRKNLLKRMLQ